MRLSRGKPTQAGMPVPQVAKTIAEEYVFGKRVEILWIGCAVCGNRNVWGGFQETSGVHTFVRPALVYPQEK
jgi:hypothetical protein